MGIVGDGGKGRYDWERLYVEGAEIVAFCDVDATAIDSSLKKFQEMGGDPSKVRRYADWRVMLEREERNIDAITVSTPDHMHAAIAVTAMRLGLHCYVQKPLVRTLWEARVFGEVARENGVVTQMGNQGSSGSGHRRNVELLQQGVIGDITEVHVWTDRPIWPQGELAKRLSQLPSSKPPATLDWEGWIGCAPMRPYIGNRPDSVKLNFDNAWAAGIKGVYHAFNWRAFYDFGTGAFGDMACHTMNLPFRGAELGSVTKAECKLAVEPTDVAYPIRSTVEVTYAPRMSRVRKGHRLPETKVIWYDGDPDDGYFYISYYDTGLLAALSYAFDSSREAKHTARNYDQYDLMMTMWYGVTDYEDETKMANVFEAEEDETLYQIEYRTAYPDAEVSYEIYKDVTNDDPSSGTLLEKGVFSHQYAGSHIIDLKNEHALKKGDQYSVVLTMKRGEQYAEVFPYSTAFQEGMTVNGIINKGESFLYANGKWSDMTEAKDSLLERAYAQCAKNLASDKSVPHIELDKKTFTVDNYPIKAISAPNGK